MGKNMALCPVVLREKSATKARLYKVLHCFLVAKTELYLGKNVRLIDEQNSNLLLFVFG